MGIMLRRDGNISMITCVVCKHQVASNKELAWHIQNNMANHPKNMQKWAANYLAHNDKKAKTH
jgi:hypothetical protein